MLSLFLSVAAGGVVFQVLVSLLLVPREPCEIWLLVYSVVFPTDPPLGSKGGYNLCDRVWLCAESVFPGAQDAPLMRGERPVCVTAAVAGVAHTFKVVTQTKMDGRQLSAVPSIQP